MEPLPFALAFDVVEESPAGFVVDKLRLANLAAYILQAERASGSWTIALALVSDDRLRELHQQFMQDDSPTDIMTFPLAGEAESPCGGDLVVSIAHLHERAGEWGLAPAEELEFLLAHGMLHLLGYRDASDGARAAMLFRQRELIAAWEKLRAP